MTGSGPIRAAGDNCEEVRTFSKICTEKLGCSRELEGDI